MRSERFRPHYVTFLKNNFGANYPCQIQTLKHNIVSHKGTVAAAVRCMAGIT